jgi:hypothetical protein
MLDALAIIDIKCYDSLMKLLENSKKIL